MAVRVTVCPKLEVGGLTARLVAGVSAARAQPRPALGPIKLTLSPAAEPVPALRYLLLPELSEQTPGNAAQVYYRAFSPEWWGNVRKREVNTMEGLKTGFAGADVMTVRFQSRSERPRLR